ncbi:MAG: penicillin-binding protein 2 [Xanthomonadales bacterium]|nr:penicillin-binding protein 2 [Xanthomonadales bacterium]
MNRRALAQALGGKSFASGRPRGRDIKDAADELRGFRRRATEAFILIVLGCLLVLARYVYLQVVSHDEFTARSINNQVKLVPVAPNRGLIYDRRGRPLAENRPAFRLQVIPEKTGDLDATLDRLAQLVALPEDASERFEVNRKRYRSFDGVPVKFDLSEDEVARFAVNRHLFSGVEVVPYLARHYPQGDMLTHVLGYVGRIDEDDLLGIDAADYRATTHIGKLGVERYYEDRLHGTSGLERVETNVQGRVLKVLERDAPRHGDDLILSLDLSVQRAAWEALGDRPGAVFAMDPRDGAVLALVSKPGYDPNLFVTGISKDAYSAIVADPGRPLFNRALQGGYEPGSTFKPFVGLAGLELGLIEPGQRVFSSGYYYLSGQERPFRDWKKGGHGWVDIRGALEESVNTYFYSLAYDLGIDRIHQYLSQFGFGRPTGLDLHGENGGILPSRDWKRGQYSEPWYPGETVIAGIGQGFNVVTPIQLSAALSALANGGQLFSPRLLLADKPPGDLQAKLINAPVAERIPVVEEENWEAVRDGMRRVIHGPRGTARATAQLVPYQMAGKSGTAQVVRQAENEDVDPEEVARHLRDHALFMAYAPYDDPIIAVAAIVEHGGGGSREAAPVAVAVIEAWLSQELPR